MNSIKIKSVISYSYYAFLMTANHCALAIRGCSQVQLLLERLRLKGSHGPPQRAENIYEFMLSARTHRHTDTLTNIHTLTQTHTQPAKLTKGPFSSVAAKLLCLHRRTTRCVPLPGPSAKRQAPPVRPTVKFIDSCK